MLRDDFFKENAERTSERFRVRIREPDDGDLRRSLGGHRKAKRNIKFAIESIGQHRFIGGQGLLSAEDKRGLRTNRARVTYFTQLENTQGRRVSTAARKLIGPHH